jgi:hypothetical protein
MWAGRAGAANVDVLRLAHRLTASVMIAVECLATVGKRFTF